MAQEQQTVKLTRYFSPHTYPHPTTLSIFKAIKPFQYKTHFRHIHETLHELAAGKEKEWKIIGREEKNGKLKGWKSPEVANLLIKRVRQQTGQCDSPGNNHQSKTRKSSRPPPFLLVAFISEDIQSQPRSKAELISHTQKIHSRFFWG